MKLNSKFVAILLFATWMSTDITAQCESWVDSPNKDEAETAHVVYRDALKAKDYALAYENWQKAYELAPAADGKRSSHYTDGIEILKYQLGKETDEAKKADLKKQIIDLYDAAVACYESKSIALKCSTDECYQVKIGKARGRQGYDMFYSLNSLYSDNLEVLKSSIMKAGLESEYVVFAPIASIVVYQFEKDLISKEEALDLYQRLEGIAEHHIVNDEKYALYYEQAWQSAKGTYSKIETEIFDCDYFKAKYKPELDANPTDPKLNKTVYNVLKARGCAETDPMVMSSKKIYESWAAQENAQRQAEFEANNPGVAAKKLYDAGDYQGAINKYKEAIANEPDASKQAGYQFSMASILFRKLKKYSEARSNAREAAKKRPGWGRPYMLIGDMYGQSARNCGDSWNQRLAILAAVEKYNYAKSIDPEVAQEAGERVSKYRASMPDQSEGFMRGVKAGQTAKVGCWIGETVKVRYK